MQVRAYIALLRDNLPTSAGLISYRWITNHEARISKQSHRKSYIISSAGSLGFFDSDITSCTVN